MFKNTTFFLLLAFFVTSTTFAAEDRSQEFILANPSFEVSGDSGAPESWNADPKFFSVTTDDSRSGNACLRWVGDGKAYKLCTQSTRLRPGSYVDFSVWVKTKDVGSGRASICIEWSRKTGEWYGGTYAHGVNGTSDWTKVSCRAKIPGDAASPHITCYVTEQGSTGEAWFDDVELKAYYPPLLEAITTDRYRGQTIGGDVEVYVGYEQTLEKFDFSKLATQFEIVDAEGNVVPADQVGLKRVESTDEYWRFSFDSTPLKVGQYRLICKAVDPACDAEQTIETNLTRLEQFPDRVSYIDENRRLIHEGKPFFPLGLYLGGASASDIELIGDSPFNCVMPYEAISREKVDALLERGVKTIYSVKDNFPGLNVQTMEQGDKQTVKTVEAMKDCPGILAWYINDELPASMVKDLAARRDQMEKLDPGRPTWVVLYQVDEIRSYLSTFDVVGSDPYPIPTKPASTAAEWTRKTSDAGFGTRAVWQVPQIFNWAAYKKNDEEKKAHRAPTFEEMRGMSWMCIAEGANGLIYYSFFDLQRMSKETKDGGRALTPEPFDERWRQVKQIASEIADQFSILTSVGQTLDVKPTPETAVDVSYRLFGTEEGTWILIVNQTSKERVVKLQLPRDARDVETRLGAKGTLEGNVLSVQLDALEPRLILIKQSF